MSNKLMIFVSNRKKGWNSCSAVTTQERREVEVAILLLNNDKNNVTTKIVLSYLQCLSSKFEV